jgi:two-component system sensor histidine kinase KdpD
MKIKKFLQYELIPFLYRHLAAFFSVILTVVTLKMLEAYLAIQLIALLFLLPVIISIVCWGLSPGILAAFLAFLSFNYYFIQPYYSLQVHKTQDLITLIIFLTVAVIMSQLIGKAREGIQLARSKEWEATRMYELISALASLQDTSSIAQVLADHTLATFNYDLVKIVIQDNKAVSQLIVTSPTDSKIDKPPFIRLPLQTARGNEGEILLWREHMQQMTPEESRLLEAYTSQGALSLERVRLVRSEYKARVLEESDRLKSSLLNSVSHELRSPLAAIKASVSSLRSGTVDWNIDARKELLATIEEETDQLNLLVGNLLDMSRIESGALKPQKRWNSISEIAMGIITKMRKQLQNHQIEIDFPQDLPLVATDYVMIGQVFTNLLSNSIKYAPPNTKIKLSAIKETDNLHIQVMNQGPSVPSEHLERIFDKFYRITDADRITGAGLGLSICKGIIEAHKGKIWAENQPDHFVFHFTIPLTLDGILPEYPKETTNE